MAENPNRAGNGQASHLHAKRKREMTTERAVDGWPRSGEGLVNQIAATIQQKIMSGEIPVGSWLRQENLAEQLGVSRTPVREALRQLQRGHLVELVPRRGCLIHGPSAQDIREAYVVRAELEGLAVTLAVGLMTDAQVDRLRDAESLFRSAVTRFTASGRTESQQHDLPHGDWLRANDMFHGVILEACGNRWLRASVAHLHESFPRNLTWAALATNSRALRQSAHEHARVRECIEKHDPSGARDAMQDHLLSAGELVAHRAEAIASSDTQLAGK